MLNALKWLGTTCVIAAASARAGGYHQIDLVLSILGAGIWAYAAHKMNDKALLAVNSFIVGILLVGVFK